MTETPQPPPVTLVAGFLRRSVRSDTFADITDAEVISFTGGLTFDAVLEPEQIAAIWARMESTDDTDQAHRALLRTPGIVNRCDLLTAYVLGDPLPDPIYPEPLEA